MASFQINSDVNRRRASVSAWSVCATSCIASAIAVERE